MIKRMSYSLMIGSSLAAFVAFTVPNARAQDALCIDTSSCAFDLYGNQAQLLPPVPTDQGVVLVAPQAAIVGDTQIYGDPDFAEPPKKMFQGTVLVAPQPAVMSNNSVFGDATLIPDPTPQPAPPAPILTGVLPAAPLENLYSETLDTLAIVPPPVVEPPPPPPPPVNCQDTNTCPNETVGKRYDNSTAEQVVEQPNTETTVAPSDDGEMFSVSVDGEHVAGTVVPADVQRKADLALAAADIQVKFDGLDVKPVLNVSTYPKRETYKAGERIDFLASSNYPAWISKSEIRIFKAGQQKTTEPVYVIPVSKEGAASWILPKTAPSELVYVLRVTDAEGRFDETQASPLTKTTKTLEPHAPQDGEVAPGYGDDRTAVRNIPVYGGAVTVYGRNVPQGHHVLALGENIPVDNQNAFVVQRILPPGDHSVDVSVLSDEKDEKSAKGFEFSRAITIPENDWFYVGLADLTVGRNFGSKAVQAVKPGEYNQTYTKGRLAFYLKGKIKGQYLLTAAADTGEDKVQNLFKGLDAKDPKQFLRRIDPNDYYPVYGDDSTTLEDAPTRGKFFVRLAKGDSHVQWGNFKTEIKGTELLRNERALYGASGAYKSEGVTSFGERKTQVSAYAAQPGTLPQRDELRGTGGSAYFLKHQDITIGSETVTIETRDHITGRVLNRRSLQYGQDYDFDFVQGLIILRSPLASTSANDTIVRDGALGGSDNYLIANYEFTPVAGQVDGYVYGGRAQQWLGDHVRVAVTGESEKTGGADQKLYGADVQFRKSERTYLEAEVARSQGPGFGLSASADGGLTMSNTATAGSAGKTADAVRIHAHAGIDEFIHEGVKGDLDAYYDHAEAGFSSLSKQITADETNMGASARIDLNEHSDATLAFDQHDSASGKRDLAFTAQANIGAGEHWTFSPGVTHSSANDLAGANSGHRTDLGARAKYDFDENQNIYVFGQATLARSGTRRENNRAGIGGQMLLTEKLGLGAEVSEGSSGLGASGKLDYKPTVDDHYYLGYTLDPDREYAGSFPSALQGYDLGAIVAGASHAYDERTSVYTESTSDLFGLRRSLNQTYGIKYTPDNLWTFGGGFEVGNIWDDTLNSGTGFKNSDFDRKAASGTVAYHDAEFVDAHLKGEARFENSQDHTRDMNSYLLQTGFNVKAWDDWRLSTTLDAVISEASATTRSGRYVEAAVGYAYRPTTDDRLNALFKYTFLYDLPGADQVNVSGATGGFSQISNILSADMNYDLTPIVTVGAKYAFRIGDTKDRASNLGWQFSSAHLGVARVDVHVVKNWDAMAEARVLWTPETSTMDMGLLAALYRQMGDNFKIGVGYNFGHFTDDLRNIGVDSQGVFINAIGKF